MKTLDISTPACPNAIVLVDDEDWDFVRRMRWTPNKRPNTMYAVCYGNERVYMHREIARARVTEDVDHANGNGLDNRRENLRRCTKCQNAYNRIARGGNSPYLGVHKLKGKDVWIAYISADKRHFRLGRFLSEEAAARARDRKAIELHGEFASLNFDDEREAA